MENELKINLNDQKKDLLLKDLCSRVPYGVKVITSVGGEIRNDKEQLNFAQLSLFEAGHEDVKPYLFPLSSMTEEQSLELEIITGETIGFDAYSIHDFTGYSEISLSKILEIIQWCYENHFDINGLIPMGLANDATGLNIY